MTKRPRANRRTAVSRMEFLAYLTPGVRLIIGNLLITVMIVGLNIVLSHSMPDLSALLIMIGTPLCLLIHWITSGRSFRQQGVNARRLAINMLLAEVYPVIGMFVSFSLRKTDDGIPFIIGFTLSILFAIGMPVIVLLSFVFREGRYISAKPSKDL